MQATRSDKAKIMVRWAFTAAAAITTALIGSSAIDQPYKAALLVMAWSLLVWLFFRNFWFQNKVIGLISRSEDRVWNVGGSSSASGHPSWLLILLTAAVIIALTMIV